jgi:hypothetical protein
MISSMLRLKSLGNASRDEHDLMKKSWVSVFEATLSQSQPFAGPDAGARDPSPAFGGGGVCT